ncbi:MAG: TIGR02444 family protein [Sphingomonadales bacterium]
MSPDHRFWDFSADLYRRSGVEAACLLLQDRFGADVNLVLYCVWIGRGLSGEALGLALEAAAPLRQFIESLRAMRRAGARGDGSYEALLKAELAAEKLEQDALEALAPPERPSAGAGTANLRLYAERLGVDADAFLATAGPLVATAD